MKIIRNLIPMLIASFLVVLSCEPEESISEIPQVNFKSLEGPFLVDIGTLTMHGANLIFEFRDGDSDFGTDTNKLPIDSNLFIVPFHKINGEYDSVDAKLYGRKYIIKMDPKLDRDGAVKGEIEVLITYLLKPPFDTIRYEFHIVDRAGNMSNKGVTSDFVW